MSVDPGKYVVKPGDTISDVDLDVEGVFLPDGRRLTEELAEQIAAEQVRAARERNLIPGRKSMSGGKKHSPVVQFRVPEQLHHEVERLAAEQGVSVSALSRKALEEYVKHPG